MQSRTRKLSTLSQQALALLVAAVPLGLAACEQAPTDPRLDPEAEASFSVSFAPEGAVASASAASTGSAGLVPGGLSRAVIGTQDVQSLVLPIGEVEAQQAGGAWISAGTIGEPVDLFNLPESGIELLDSTLPEGQYVKLRFWLDGEPTITLARDVRVGRHVYTAGEPHPLTIPGAAQAGVRLVADFTIDADGEALMVLVDGAAMLRKVVATGSGMLKIAPVLSVRNEAGAEIGEDEDETKEEKEAEVEVEGAVSSADAAAGTFTLDDGTTVRIVGETEIEGDFLSLADVADALLDGAVVEAEVEGELEADGTTVRAAKVEFETEDDEGEEEVEAEGTVTAVDASERTLTLDDDGTVVVVRLSDDTELELGKGLADWAAVVAAFEAGTPLRAEAEGELNEAQELVAWEVEIEIVEDDD